MPNLKEDFEVKRFVLGLSSLIVNCDMPQIVKDNYGNIIKALIFLSNRSIEIRQMEENKKEEMAEVQQEAPSGEIIEDEDDIGVAPRNRHDVDIVNSNPDESSVTLSEDGLQSSLIELEHLALEAFGDI